MPTRDEEAEQWQAISLNSRKAAQHLLEDECYRSSVSRAYYAAYSALTAALIRQGITLGYGGNNPEHAGLPVLIVNNLTALPLTARYDLNKVLRRLYRARVEAHYAAVTVVDNAAAKRSIRDLARVSQILGLEYKGNADMATMTVKIEPESIVQEIVGRVRPYLERHPIQNVVPQIIEDALHLEEGWWYVPVRFNSQEPRTYEYYDTLTDIEDEIAAQEHLQVLSVPAG